MQKKASDKQLSIPVFFLHKNGFFLEGLKYYKHNYVTWLVVVVVGWDPLVAGW